MHFFLSFTHTMAYYIPFCFCPPLLSTIVCLPTICCPAVQTGDKVLWSPQSNSGAAFQREIFIRHWRENHRCRRSQFLYEMSILVHNLLNLRFLELEFILNYFPILSYHEFKIFSNAYSHPCNKNSKANFQISFLRLLRLLITNLPIVFAFMTIPKYESV